MQRLHLLEFAIEQANDGIAIMEFQDDPLVPIRIIYANAAIERLSGYSRDQIYHWGNPFFQVQPKNHPRYEAMFRKIREGEPVRFEIELGGHDRATWCEIRWTPLRYMDSEVTHYLAVLREATGRADEPRELLHRAVEDSLDLVAIYDATALSEGGPRLKYANRALRNALGYDAETMMGMSYRQFLAEDNDGLDAAHIARFIESGRPFEKEINVVRRDGSTFRIEFAAYPIHAEQLKGHWFVIARDISSRRKTLRDTAIVTRAMEVLPIPVEIYVLQAGEPIPVFRNPASEHAGEAAREARLEQALTSVAVRPLQSEALVVPICGEDGIADSIVAFVQTPYSGPMLIPLDGGQPMR